MKDFAKAAEGWNPMFALQLKSLDWRQRVEAIWLSITALITSIALGEMKSLLKENAPYRGFWENADELLKGLVELFFLAIEWEKLEPFHKKEWDRWEVRRDCDHEELRKAEGDFPILQARKAIEIYRLLPKYGSAKVSRLSDGGDPEMAGSEIMVYEQARQALLAKVAECWANVESKETADEMLSFLIDVLLSRSNLGPYGSSAVKALRDTDKTASSLRIGRALMRIYPELRDNGPIQDAFDVLRVGWVKKMPHAKIRFLAEVESVLDRSLPEAAEKEMIGHAKAVAHLMDVARSFIDHSQKSLIYWGWPGLSVQNMSVILILECDRCQWHKKEIEEAGASWISPDPSVRLVIRGRKNLKNLDGPDLFTVELPERKQKMSK